MTYSNLRFANDAGGILADQESGIPRYVDAALPDLYADFLGGTYGTIAPFVPPPPDLPDLPAYAAQRRWEKEVGGTVVVGMVIHTDDRSKTLLMGARQAADADPAFTTQWKTANGTFIILDATMIVAASNAVLAHVAACFAREAAVLAAIDDGTITTTAQIDSAFDAVEWPEIV